MSSTTRCSFAGREVPVVIARSPRARLADVEKFLAAHHGWIATRVAKWPVAVPFTPGAAIPFDGASLSIDWSLANPRGVWRVDDRLVIGGPEATVPGRTLRWLRAAALADMVPATHAIAALIDRQVTGIAVRDPAGRWGSCSSRGTIGYSWRLILAPPGVRQSVVAHEVAHLVHPNHGRDFWKLATDLTDGDLTAARAWLAANGAALHWVGRAA
jgi:predicted metal-dependent hydrolase